MTDVFSTFFFPPLLLCDRSPPGSGQVLHTDGPLQPRFFAPPPIDRLQALPLRRLFPGHGMQLHVFVTHAVPPSLPQSQVLYSTRKGYQLEFIVSFPPFVEFLSTLVIAMRWEVVSLPLPSYPSVVCVTSLVWRFCRQRSCSVRLWSSLVFPGHPFLLPILFPCIRFCATRNGPFAFFPSPFSPPRL